MEHIWSPWRMKYMRENQGSKSCIFCDAVEMEDGIENLIVKRGRLAFVILNRYPYTSGHVMVVPYAHTATLAELDTDVLAEVMALIQQSIQTITTVYKPDGFNIGANLGTAAGAGIAGHIHFHVVPRWGGDTNFMTTACDVRVIPEDLGEALQHLKESWPN